MRQSPARVVAVGISARAERLPGNARPGEEWPSAADISKKDLRTQPEDACPEPVSS